MTFPELHQLYHQPFFALLQQGRAVHEAHWPAQEVQLCTLLSIKTGGCSEDCSYCAQSARYDSGLKVEKLMEKCDIMKRAQAARENTVLTPGRETIAEASRIGACDAIAWRPASTDSTWARAYSGNSMS